MLSILPSTSTTLAFVALIVGFGFIIFIHELGHFLAAKWVGIKVTQFAVGFGHSVFSWRKGIGFRVGGTEPEFEKRIAAKLKEQGRTKDDLDSAGEKQLLKDMGLGETEYRLNWIPLGGYVRMLGQEDLKPEAISADPRSFNSRPVWARAIVVSAGVIMNLLSAVAFFIVAFSAGVAFPPSIAGPVLPGAPAGMTYATGHENQPGYRGLKPGDHILSINGKPMSDFMEVAVSSALSARGEKLDVKVQRDGVDQPLNYVLVARPDHTTNLLSLGIMPPRSNILEILPKDVSQAHPKLKLPAVAIEAQGKPITSFGQYYHIVAQAQGQPVAVTFADYPDRKTTTVIDVQASPMLSSPRKTEGLPDLIGLTPATRVGSVIKDSPAEKAGVKEGDLIAQIGATAWPDVNALRATVSGHGEKPLKLVVDRKGKKVDLGTITPSSKGTIGIYLGLAMDVPIISKTQPDSPAAEALELTPGSRITQINGKDVHNWADMQRSLTEAAKKFGKDGGQITIDYELNMAGQIKGQTKVTLNAAETHRLLMTYWVPDLIDGFSDLRRPIYATSLYQAAVMGVVKTKHYMLQTYVTLLRLFQGTVQASQMRGPVGIVYEGTRVAKLGWTYLLFFLGLISVNLAVVNFLPIPVVDGGLMVFLIIEKIKGSPVNMKVQNVATIVGLALILGVFALTLFYDLSRIVS